MKQNQRLQDETNPKWVSGFGVWDSFKTKWTLEGASGSYHIPFIQGLIVYEYKVVAFKGHLVPGAPIPVTAGLTRPSQSIATRTSSGYPRPLRVLGLGSTGFRV